jgi:hypothetical protein
MYVISIKSRLNIIKRQIINSAYSVNLNSDEGINKRYSYIRKLIGAQLIPDDRHVGMAEACEDFTASWQLFYCSPFSQYTI